MGTSPPTPSESATVVAAVGFGVLVGEGVVASARGTPGVAAGRAKADGHDRERAEQGSAKPSSSERPPESLVHCAVS